MLIRVLTLYLNFNAYFTNTKWSKFYRRIVNLHLKLYNLVALGDILSKSIGLSGK